jgi:hypothetical protein
VKIPADRTPGPKPSGVIAQKKIGKVIEFVPNEKLNIEK